MNGNSTNNKIYVSDDEIDIFALLQPLFKYKKQIVKFVSIFFVLGLFVAVFSKKEYTASTVFIAQVSDGKVGGSIGGLAEMAGINLSSLGGSNEINPLLYPRIIDSKKFKKELLNTVFSFENGRKKITYQDYYSKHYKRGLLENFRRYTIGLPGVLKKYLTSTTVSNDLISEDSKLLLKVSKKEYDLMEKMNDQLLLEVNEDDGYITISTTMDEPYVAAEFALKSQLLLQKYIIDFRIQKSKEQLEYIKERYFEVENKFKQIQLEIADFQDKNKYVSNAKSKIDLQSLQDRYELVYGVFTQLSKQLEMQYIKVTENTPVFTVIEPVSVPVEKSKPKRLIIIISYSFFGFLFSILYVVLIKNIYPKIKEKLNEI